MDTPQPTKFFAFTVASEFGDQTVFLVEAESYGKGANLIPLKPGRKIVGHVELTKSGTNRVIYGTIARLAAQLSEVSQVIKEEGATNAEDS